MDGARGKNSKNKITTPDRSFIRRDGWNRKSNQFVVLPRRL
jgi:hypothetical protein